MPLQLWRLYRAAYGPGLDGAGGTFAEGRWHSRGSRVVYFGASAAIVVLERLAHTDPDLLPADLRLGLFSLPDKEGASVTSVDAPPRDWQDREDWSRKTGDHWLTEGVTCLLSVPSAILPEETNFLLNPTHAAAKFLELERERPFAFDPRLI